MNDNEHLTGVYARFASINGTSLLGLCRIMTLGSFVGNFGLPIRKVRPCSMLLKMKYTPYAFCFSRRRSAGRTQSSFRRPFWAPFHRDLMMAGKGLHPGLIIVGALAEHLFAHHRDTVHLTDKMNHLFWPR